MFLGIKGHVAQDILVIYLRQFHTLYNYVACTQQATRCGVQDTQRAGLAHVIIYAHRERSDFRSVNSATISVCLGHKISIATSACQAGKHYHQF